MGANNDRLTLSKLGTLANAGAILTCIPYRLALNLGLLLNEPSNLDFSYFFVRSCDAKLASK
jgi:hypothetical protein